MEGYAFHMSGVTSPEVLADQMLFRRMVVMKIFLSAMGSSMLAQAALRSYKNRLFDQTRFYAHKTAGLPRVVVGSLTLGVGMTLAGSGPTMLPAQLGAGVAGAPRVLAGMLAGGLLYAFLEKRLPALTHRPSVIGSEDGGISYEGAAVPLGAAAVAAAVALEYVFPHADEAPLSATLLPTIAGAVVGLNQVPLRLITGDGQGGSTSIMSMLATGTLGKVTALRKYAVTSVATAGQLLYLYAGMLGGARAAAAAVPAASGFGATREVLGGVLMMLGARVANGCTCGLGISGTSELAIDAFAGAGAIFAGAIGTAVALNILF
eukprot:TRINITY_DN1398_c1_g2_i1.p1 TRINITY_DN1398_c1_g2~~TRINITY_DN1398_c1_g2_i1.p1  ORF type:complete len:352 (+),score=116.97 TRINITY_DN1398_c1_g2_i1:98-1057(+)